MMVKRNADEGVRRRRSLILEPQSHRGRRGNLGKGFDRINRINRSFLNFGLWTLDLGQTRDPGLGS